MSSKRSLFKAVFGEELKEQSYKMVPHSFTKNICGKQYCSKCGLFLLNNDFSKWASDKGCEHNLHPSFKSQMKKAGGI